MRTHTREVVGWLTVLLGVGVILPLVGFESGDPDSALYAAIAADLSTRPVGQWLAPEWWGHWDIEGLFREHPVGIFLPSAVLASIGYPALQAAYIVNAVYQVLTLIFIQRLAAFYVPGAVARSLVWIVQLLPIAFAYRIRANHEQAVVLCLVAALYATVRSRSDARWMVVTTLAFLYMFMVKGLLMAFAPVSCAWLLLVSRWASPRQASHDSYAWAGLALAVGVTGVAAGLYETAYLLTTGESFYAVYLGKWMSLGFQTAAQPWVLQKVNNFFWYFGRLLWFAFPWSLAACWAMWSVRGDLSQRRVNAPLGKMTAEKRRALVGLVTGLGIVALYIGLLSLSNHRTDRYLFPGYIVLGACGAAAAAWDSGSARRTVLAMDRWHPYTAMLVYCIGFALSLASNLTGWL